MIWLDFKLFGNGHGLKSPFFDDKFYWLVNTEQKDRNARDGNFYKWIGGFGAQLQSHEWRAPPAGTTRRLFGRQFRVFNVSRRWFRVQASWAVCLPDRVTREDLTQIKKELEDNVY